MQISVSPAVVKRQHSRALSNFAILLMFALLVGCSTNKVPDVLDFGTGPGINANGERQMQNITWPSVESGETPRYKYAGELYGEENFRAGQQVNKSVGDYALKALRWLVGLIVGEEQPVMLQRPQAGVADAEGKRILITDASRQAVYVFDQAAGKLDIWSNATESTLFVTPTGIALGAANDVYVADADLAYVTRLNARGESLAIIGKGVLNRPVGVAFDRVKQRLYVADTHDHNIKVFDAAGNLQRTFGKKGEQRGEFNSPTFLVLAKDELYVTDTLNARVQVLDAETGLAKRMVGQRGINMGDLVRPKGVAVDSDGNVYVVESYHDYLLVFNRKGEFLMPIGGTGEGVGQFYQPASVWVDQQDNVFVADMFNARVMRFQYLKEPPVKQAVSGATVDIAQPAK